EKDQGSRAQHGKLERVHLTLKSQNLDRVRFLLLGLRNEVRRWWRRTPLSSVTDVERQGRQAVKRLLHLGDRGLCRQRDLFLTPLPVGGRCRHSQFLLRRGLWGGQRLGRTTRPGEHIPAQRTIAGGFATARGFSFSGVTTPQRLLVSQREILLDSVMRRRSGGRRGGCSELRCVFWPRASFCYWGTGAQQLLEPTPQGQALGKFTAAKTKSVRI